MTRSVGIVMDPIAGIKPVKDTTLALALAAQARGWQLHYMQMGDLFINQGEARARSYPLRVRDDNQSWFELDAPVDIDLGDLDVIFMRKDPPFDNQFLYSTHILELAEKQGALVVNRPQSLRDCNEKIFATHFPEFCPPVIVTSEADHLREFHAEHEDIILKPLDGMGGTGIFRVAGLKAPNLSVIIETLTHNGSRPIMAQRYIPEIKEGDKRVLVVDGEPVPYCLARIPPEGETRGNLAAGGRGEARPLSPRDLEIAQALGPELKRRGLMFVGLDIIGDYLTEVNVTSPTCAREIDKAFNTDIGGMLMDAVAKQLDARA